MDQSGAGRFAGQLQLSPTSQGDGAGRLAWADVAKGVCIVLVVLWHVIMKHYLQIDWRISLPLAGAWGTVGEVLLPLRMPLFFAISGFFAARALLRPWRAVARSRVAKFLYLYVLWLCVHTALFSFVPDFGTESAHSVLEFVEQLTITPTNLWYLYALAIYFVLAKLADGARIPRWCLLAAAFLLSATASAELLPTPGDRGGFYQNLVFFLVGLFGKSFIERIAEQASWPRLVVVAVPYGAALAAIHYFGIKTLFGLWPVVSLLAVFLGVTAVSLVARRRRVTAAITSIGRRTLPIYVIHMPLLALLHVVLVDPLSSLGPQLQLVLAAIEPIVLTAALTAICLLLHGILPTAWIFDLPARPARQADPAPDPVGESPTRPIPRVPVRHGVAPDRVRRRIEVDLERTPGRRFES